MPTLFQAGLFVAFLQGIYQGEISCADLAKHGDTGLGTFNNIDGEMIALDGNIYRCDAQGMVHLASPNTLTPFSVISRFEPTMSMKVKDISTLALLNQFIDAHLPTKNIFYMLRIDCHLQSIKMRSEHACLNQEMQLLIEVLPKLQVVHTLKNTSGSMIATYCPNYSAAFTIPSYHYHFINQDKTVGGHVFNIELISADVHIMPIRDFQMILPTNANFNRINLDVDVQQALTDFTTTFHED